MRHLRFLVVLILLGVAVAGAAQAESRLSTSTDPSVGIAKHLSGLIGQENRVFSALNEDDLAYLGPRVSQPSPPRPEQKVKFSNDWLDAQPYIEGDAQWRCMAEALYFEARGESVKGQYAVAEVIMNRVASPHFPDTVCHVVHQGGVQRYHCQFSYHCDGRAEVIHEHKAYRRVAKVAYSVLHGANTHLTRGATHYHTTSVRPAWSKRLVETASIGRHDFYRYPSS